MPRTDQRNTDLVRNHGQEVSRYDASVDQGASARFRKGKPASGARTPRRARLGKLLVFLVFLFGLALMINDHFGPQLRALFDTLVQAAS